MHARAGVLRVWCLRSCVAACCSLVSMMFGCSQQQKDWMVKKASHSTGKKPLFAELSVLQRQSC